MTPDKVNISKQVLYPYRPSAAVYKFENTAAHELAKRYGFHVYSTDDNRDRHFTNADPTYQPALCRNIHDYWALKPADANAWEGDIVHDFTPMVVADLLELAGRHERGICEGHLDIDVVMPIVTHCVAISYNGSVKRDFFDRSDHRHILENIRGRNDLTAAEKDYRVRNAYEICAVEHPQSPGNSIEQYGIPHIVTDETTTVEEMAGRIADVFMLKPNMMRWKKFDIQQNSDLTNREKSCILYS